jgi:hypothetical protein
MGEMTALAIREQAPVLEPLPLANQGALDHRDFLDWLASAAHAATPDSAPILVLVELDLRVAAPYAGLIGADLLLDMALARICAAVHRDGIVGHIGGGLVGVLLASDGRRGLNAVEAMLCDGFGCSDSPEALQPPPLAIGMAAWNAARPTPAEVLRAAADALEADHMRQR